MNGSPLAAWQSFYVVVGSSAAALTGLMFVVIALGAERRIRAMPHVVDAFGTPTVVHFCAVFVVSVLMSAPWSGVGTVGALLGVIGAAGTVYVFIVLRRTLRQNEYHPVLEDWIWHTVLPVTSYLAIGVGSLLLPGGRDYPFYIIGAAAVLFVLIGIHNAWDAVTYNALLMQQSARHRDSTPTAGPG